MRDLFDASKYFRQLSTPFAVLLIASASLILGVARPAVSGEVGPAAQVELGYMPAPAEPVPLEHGISRGCALVNSGRIDFEGKVSTGGGTTSEVFSQLQAGEWLTLHVSASLAVVAFLNVFEPRTTRRLQSKMIATIDPQIGAGSMALVYPVSPVEARNSLQIATGFQGAGTYKVTVRCTRYDPRKFAS